MRHRQIAARAVARPTHPRSPRVGPLACIVPLIIVLASCTVAPAPPSATLAPQGLPTPRWTDPPNRTGEITRSSYNGTTIVSAAVAGPLPAGQLTLETFCDGTSTSSIAYTFEGAGGTVFGPPGRIRCNETTATTPFESPGIPTGENVQIELHPGAGVKKGYAILVRSDQEATASLGTLIGGAATTAQPQPQPQRASEPCT